MSLPQSTIEQLRADLEKVSREKQASAIEIERLTKEIEEKDRVIEELKKQVPEPLEFIL